MSHFLALAYMLLQVAAAQTPPSQVPAPVPLPAEAVALLHSGAAAEERGDLEAAVADFRKAADRAPDSAVCFFRLGDAYMKKLDYADALPPLRRALVLNPESPVIHQLLGYALLAQGYASEAIPHLTAVHDSAALGIAQLQAGQFDQAVANLQAALAANPNDPDLLYYMSRAANALSSRSADNLLSRFPDSARGHQMKAQTLFRMKMFEESAKEYERALALRPDLPGLRLELGQVFAAQSDWAKAEPQFRLETKLQPGNAEAEYRLGDSLLQQGMMAEAAAELRHSDALRPDMPETLYALGKASAISNPDQAEGVLRRVVEMEKDTQLAAEADFALAGIYRRQGKAELATHEMQEFKRIRALTETQTGSRP